MKNAATWVLTAAVAATAGVAGLWLGRQNAAPSAGAPPQAEVQQNAAPETAATPAEIAVLDLSGQAHTLSEWRGSLVVVNFWATWCPPCVTEIPAFVQLQQEWGGRGLQFVGIALDDLEPTRQFVQTHGVNYPILVGENEVMQMMREMGNAIGGLPYTVVLDREGQQRYAHQGEWSLEDARRTLDPLLTPVQTPELTSGAAPAGPKSP